MERLSCDVLLSIFNNIDSIQVVSVKRVNKKWSEIIDDSKSLYRVLILPTKEKGWDLKPLELFDKKSQSSLKQVSMEFDGKETREAVFEILDRSKATLHTLQITGDRAAIVAGSVEPTSEEVKAGEASDDVDEDDEEDVAATKESLADATAPADGAKGIPEFWLTALKNHVALSELITEEDENALKALTDIKMTHLPGTESGFKLTFTFGENEHFTNKELTKTYYYQDEVGYSGDLVYDHAEGCTIDWKEGKDLTHKIETKKQRNKNTNQTRTVKRSVPVESFFNFFSPPTPPKDGEDEEDEADLDELDERLELDYQIGEDLKDRIVPRAVDFFTGKALQYEDMDDLDDGDFDDEDDEDDDDDDDDEPVARRSQISAGSQMAGSQDPQECKQQ
ncbi:hypothetical protein L7F22_010509 [Adiantum nelumboides]|nr:hypothetical protein [Adiantum nelumboides]